MSRETLAPLNRIIGFTGLIGEALSEVQASRDGVAAHANALLCKTPEHAPP